MKKNNEKGFMLIETLLVSIFVASTLIYLYIQFSNLNKNYNNSFTYNTVEGMYALEDVKEYLNLNIESVRNEIFDNTYSADICSILPDSEYCTNLLEKENITTLIVAYNDLSNSNFDTDFNQGLLDFMEKIQPTGDEEFRIVAEFNNKTFATLRF